MVWVENDGLNENLLYLAAGATTPSVVASSTELLDFPSISDSGEIVWSQDINGTVRLLSNQRGDLTIFGCTAAADYWEPALDNNGNLVFSLYDLSGSGGSGLYQISAPAGSPVASFSIDSVQNPGSTSISYCDTVALDGTLSIAGTGRTITSWRWDLDNNGSFETTGSSIVMSPPAVGVYPVTLQVEDDQGNINTVIHNVTLVNHVPVANAGGPYTVTGSGSVTLDGSLSTDPDNCDVASLTYEWDLNSDGNFTDASGISPVVTNATLQTLGLGAGAHTATLKVTDGGGLSGQASTQLQIDDYLAVTSPNGGEELYSGTPVTVTWTAPSNAATFHLRYWDGSTYHLLKISATGNSWTWTVPTVATRTTGNYFHITAMDSSGAQIGWDTSDATFAINPPALDLTGPTNGASYTEPATVNLTVNAGPVVTSVDYFSNGSLIGTATSAPFTYNWTNVPAGTYTITAQGHDGTGGTFNASGSTTITVSAQDPVTVTSPNGGEELYSGTPVTVTWNSAPNAATYHLRYWDGSTYHLLKISAAGNSWTWTVPTVATRTTGNYFHITAMDSSGAQIGWDTSDASFAINP
jgi:hypothetical protein